MKKILITIGCLVVLVGCSDVSDSIVQVEEKKGPSIPKVAAQADLLNESIKEDSSENPSKNLAEDPVAMDSLIDRINKDLVGQDITKAEIKQGWYYAEEGERKWGTPSSWVWTQHEGGSYWISPDALKKFNESSADRLCRSTGGYYVISCVESELPHCEYIPESTCRCAEDSVWNEEQGCLMVDDDEEWIEITSDELKQGWYSGLLYEKKYNTPPSWVWVENEEGGRWQNESRL